MPDEEIASGGVPSSEADRLNALAYYEILDTPAEDGFDTLCRLAAAAFECTDAHICFVGPDHVSYKATTGTLADNTINKENSPCALSIDSNEVTILNDSDNDTPHHTFYAAAPIITNEGFVLGTIAVTDSKPHPIVTPQQINMLQLLASLIMEKLEIRLSDKKVAATYNERLRTLAHDIKNPVTSISLYAQLLGAKEMHHDKVFTMAGRIETSLKRIEEQLNNLFI